jgi:hypothetical protein
LKNDFWCGWPAERTPRIEWPQDGVDNDSHSLANHLPLLLREVSCFCVKLNASWRVRGGNGEVILAVSEGLEDIGIKAVWMNKWMGVWIGFTFIWLKRG